MNTAYFLDINVTRYTELFFFVGYPTLLRFFCYAYISANPIVLGYFYFAQFVTLFKGADVMLSEAKWKQISQTEQIKTLITPD